MDSTLWYQQLVKPAWAPPSWLFGPVWTVLYLGIAVTFSTVIYRSFVGRYSWLVALPFILNIVFNLLFTPLQFWLRNNLLASIDVALVVATLAWAIIMIFSRERWIAFANLPYLLWACFATVLQVTITYLNWR